MHKADAALLRQANMYRALFKESQALRIPPTFSDLSEAHGLLHIRGCHIEILSTPDLTKALRASASADCCSPVSPYLATALAHGLPVGSASDMDAIQLRLADLPGDLIVHPRHGAIGRYSKFASDRGAMKRVAIVAIESAFPNQVVTNADLARENPGWDMKRLLERTGVGRATNRRPERNGARSQASRLMALAAKMLSCPIRGRFARSRPTRSPPTAAFYTDG